MLQDDELPLGRGEVAEAFIGDRNHILDTHTEFIFKIYARLHGHYIAGNQFFMTTHIEIGIFVNLNSDTVTEAVPKEMFPRLREDVELLSLASYFAQVAEAVSQEDAPDPELLSLLLNSLYVLGKESRPQTLVKAVFELKVMCLAGYLPDLSGCAVCGREDADRFNITQGVLQCASCSGGDGGIRMPLSAGTLAAMRYIVSAPVRSLLSFRLTERSCEELSGITESYLCTKLERGFYTLDFYKSLFLKTEFHK